VTKIYILMMCAMAACMVTSSEDEHVSEQGLVCDPNCDPANMQTVLAALIGEGRHIGQPAGPAYCRVVHGYDDYGDPQASNECSNIYQGTGQQYLVDCADANGPVTCATLACGEPNQPHCQ